MDSAADSRTTKEINEIRRIDPNYDTVMYSIDNGNYARSIGRGTGGDPYIAYAALHLASWIKSKFGWS